MGLPSLGEQNREMLARYLAPLPPAAQSEALDALQQGYESSVEPSPPAPESPAPEIRLTDHRGSPFALSEARATVVLSFYRGGWCDYCANALRALQRRLPAIRVHGGLVVGISPESREAAVLTSRRNRLEFPLLHDQDNAIADRYGLRTNLAPLLAPLYARFEIDMPEDAERLDVPYPATIIVRPNGIVHSTFVRRDPSERMAPEDIAAQVREVAQRQPSTTP
jgi:peroxiredoxin